MSILMRIGRILRSNIQWLLDKAQPCEQELQARVQELSGAVQECKAAAGTYGASFRRLQKQAADLVDRVSLLDQQAEQAIRAGDDETARLMLSEKFSAAGRLAQLEPTIEQGRKTYEHLRESLAKLSDALAQARARQAELLARQRSADARKTFGEQLDHAQVTGGEMFERAQDEVLQAEAYAEVVEDINSGFDLEKHSRQLQVEAEIAAIKQRLGGQKI